MLPFVGTHHLIIHLVFQNERLESAFEDGIEPLVTKLPEIDLRHRVRLVSSQNVQGVAQVAERPPLAPDMVVRTDDQIVLGTRIEDGSAPSARKAKAAVRSSSRLKASRRVREQISQLAARDSQENFRGF
jgi:hypothetical protein